MTIYESPQLKEFLKQAAEDFSQSKPTPNKFIVQRMNGKTVVSGNGLTPQEPFIIQCEAPEAIQHEFKYNLYVGNLHIGYLYHKQLMNYKAQG